MTMKKTIASLVIGAAIAVAPVNQASAHGYYHHSHGGPVFGLFGAAVAIATLPVRVVGGAVAAATYPVRVQPYPQPVYYAAPQPYPVYAQPVYYPQPAYAYPQPQGYYQGQ